MVLDKLDDILSGGLEQIKNATTSEEIAVIRNTFLSKKSELMLMFSLLGKLEPEERKDAGKRINDVKVALSEALEQKQKEIE